MCAMPDKSSSRFSLDLLNLAGYFIVPAVGIPMLWDLFQSNDPNRWLVSGVLALFTLVYSLRSQIVENRKLGAYFYTSLQTILIIVLIVLSPQQLIAVVLFFVLSAEVTMMYPPRIVAAWIALFTAITLVAYLAVSGLSGLVAVPIYAAGYVFFAIFAQQTARAEAARAESERLLLQLQEAHSQLQEYASQAEELAVQQERNRLAREMHDTLGHRLTVSSVQLQAAQRLIPSAPDRANEMVGAVLEEVREGLRELRSTVATLRAPVEADLALEPALKRLAGSFEQATGIAVHLVVPADLPPLTASQRHALYRGAQEGLTNIQKHAAAGEAWIELARTNGTVALLVRDNGAGLSGAGNGAAGFGLHGLRERAAQLGGDLSISPAPAGGAEMKLTLPLPQEAPHG
jgi:signal transduction histidine kinase